MATEVVEPAASKAPPAKEAEAPSDHHDDSGRSPSSADGGEGVEVIMDSHGKSAVMDQNVFRAPHPVRPRAIRGAPPPHVQSSGSYGYPPHDYGRPYPVPYTLSGSFDEAGGSYHHPPPPPPTHYSPHVQYPPPGGRHPEDVNVISPHHGTPKPPMTPSRRYGHYQYPPASPVSRPGGAAATPPRARNYAMRRPEGPYSAATRGHPPPEYGTPAGDRSRPPLVTESSFDSEHYSSHASHSNPATPNAPHYGPPVHPEPHYSGSFYGASFGGSFDSHAPPPPHFDDHRYYGHHHSPYSHPPESPYHSPYGAPYHGYSPSSGYYDPYSPHPDYHRGYDEPTSGKKDPNSGMILPKAAEEIDFDVTDPPMEPHTPPSKTPVCESPGDVNTYDVLCGRGGGTNSQVGNRRFRKLVQEFQPIYLLARRKEKPLLARTIVLIIRKRGGRFLKKDDETGELYEVGDTKAEAKTSQALREGLDVRATKSAASLLDKKKKSKKAAKSKTSEEDEKAEESPEHSPSSGPASNLPQSPPVLPRLNGEEKPAPRSPSPESMQFRKRRRMRSTDGADETMRGCHAGFQDKFFSDFCPPRAEIGRNGSPTPYELNMDVDASTPTRGNNRYEDDDDDDIRAEQNAQTAARGCAGIAMDVMNGAVTRGFCIGPRSWR